MADKLNKLRNGQEISADYLNSIVDKINSLIDDHSQAELDRRNTDDALKEFDATLSNLNSKYLETLSNVPNLQQIVSEYIAHTHNIIKFNDNINSSDSPLDKTSEFKFDITNNLTKYGVHKDEYEKTFVLYISNSGNSLYFYYNKSLYNLSMYCSTPITMPSISMGDNGNWFIGGEDTGKPSRGETGSKGDNGKDGERGLKGDRGERGLTGNTGNTGASGKTTKIQIGSGNTKNNISWGSYKTGDKYFAFRTYEEGMSSEEISRQEPQIIQVIGDVYYPHVENTTDSNGNAVSTLYFSKQTPGDETNKLNIKGEKGEQGNRGFCPEIVFVDKDDNNKQYNITKKESVTTYDDNGNANGVKELFDATVFKGAKGNGISSVSTTRNGSYVKVKFTLDDGTSKDFELYDGKDGTSVKIKGSFANTASLPDSGATAGDGYLIGNNLYVYTGSSEDASTKGFKNVGQIKGSDGDPGTAAGFGTVSATVDNNTGTPSVTVTTSGEDTAKNFSFAFSNLKGGDGANGKGISSVEKVSSTETSESYQLKFNYTDNSTPSTITVNKVKGSNGNNGKSIRKTSNSRSTLLSATSENISSLAEGYESGDLIITADGYLLNYTGTAFTDTQTGGFKIIGERGNGIYKVTTKPISTQTYNDYLIGDLLYYPTDYSLYQLNSEKKPQLLSSLKGDPGKDYESKTPAVLTPSTNQNYVNYYNFYTNKLYYVTVVYSETIGTTTINRSNTIIYRHIPSSSLTTININDSAILYIAEGYKIEIRATDSHTISLSRVIIQEM